MNNDIVYIPVDMLIPHPQNPRKNLGDLTELADSIRANGIYQNMTVVPTRSNPDTFTVIIGHRRLAAAKLAGLTEVPCVIADMTEKQQIETMLLENMQRSDLTVVEEAQGLQLLIDLGEDVPSLAQATGFSKKKIKNRLMLNDYDPQSVERAFKHGATIEDYVNLQKIKDDKRRADVAKYLGTSDFKWKLEKALDREKWLIEKEKIIGILESAGAVERTRSEAVSYKKIDYVYTKKDAQRIVDEREGRDLMYYLPYESANYLAVMSMYLEEEIQGAEPAQLSEKQLTKEFCYVRHDSLIKSLKSCIRGFIEGFDDSDHASISAKMRYINDLLFIFIQASAEYSGYTTYFEGDKLLGLLNIDRKQVKGEDDQMNSEAAYTIRNDIGKNTLKYLLALCWSTTTVRTAPSTFYIYSSSSDSKVCAEYRRNPYMEMFVAVLVQLGFGLPEELKSYLDGTHPIYTEEGCEQLYADRNKEV